jgi:histidine kinase
MGKNCHLRYKIGELLLEDSHQYGLEKNIYIILNFLDNDSCSLPQNKTKRVMLAELNLKAGEKAMKGAAFESAAYYSARGICLLPEGHWDTNVDLCLELYSLAAEAHHCIGKDREAQSFCEAVCSRADIPILDKQRAYIVHLDSLSADMQTVLAQEKCIEVLALLGCHFPIYAWGLHTLVGLLKTELSVKSLANKIPKLGVMTDETKKFSMQLLDRLVTFAYQNKSDIFALVILKSLKYTLKCGVSDYSPPMLATVGLLLSAGMGDLEFGRKFGELALSKFYMTSGHISRRAKARTLFVASAFSLHWQLPMSNLRTLLLDGYRTGLGSGDVESGLWCIFCYLDMAFYLGLPMRMLEKDCLIYMQQMKGLKAEKMYLHMKVLLQLLQNLLRHPDDSTESFDSSHFRLEMEQNCGDVAQVDRLRLHTAFWGGDYWKIVNLMEELGTGYFDKNFPGSYGLTAGYFHCALAFFFIYEEKQEVEV